MKKHTHIHWLDWLLPVGLGLLVWLFFGLFYPHHLHYQEQMQLFLTTSDYLHQHLMHPGGLAIYLGGFFTQFFIDAVWGALVIALLLVVVQQLVALLARSVEDKPVYRWLTALPPILYALLLCHEDMMLSGLVAWILALAAAVLFTRIRIYGVRMAYLLCMIPALYWLVGVSCVVFLSACLFIEWTGKEGRQKRILNAGMVLFSVLLFILSVLLAKAVVGNMPLKRFWLAGNYYRFVNAFPSIILYVQGSVVAVLMLVKWLPVPKRNWLLQAVQVLLLAVVAGGGIYAMADWSKEEVMAYDYYARMRQWNEIIQLADRQSPNGPLTVATLNLALSQTGYLPDRMFSYFQNGPEGLLPAFGKEYMSTVMTGEIYYRLGMMNTAQQYAFEAMEMIPDYQKSARSVKRLAETNLINGRYDVAAKYLHLLRHTFYYKAWATDALTYLGDDARIQSHPEWGVLRSYRLSEDFFFSEGEKDMMLGVLFQSNTANHTAYEYLMAYVLLSKDLSHFRDYFLLGQQTLTYRAIPKSYQEALAYVWSMTNPNAQPPAQVSREVLQRMDRYRQIYTSLQNAEPALRKDFGDTFWYYMHFRRN